MTSDDSGLEFRQKEMQFQLQKITDLVRLIVQKMDISAEMEVNDTSNIQRNDSHQRIKKVQLLLQASRRFASAGASYDRHLNEKL